MAMMESGLHKFNADDEALVDLLDSMTSLPLTTEHLSRAYATLGYRRLLRTTTGRTSIVGTARTVYTSGEGNSFTLQAYPNREFLLLWPLLVVAYVSLVFCRALKHAHCEPT